MDANDILQYKELYIQTGKEDIQNLNQLLLRLEKDPRNSEALGEIMRLTHSLKGSSAMMKYTKMSHLCHVIEDMFNGMIKSGATLQPSLFDLLFQAFDALLSSLQSIEKNDTEADVSQITNDLVHLSGVQTEMAPADQANNADSEIGEKSIPDKFLRTSLKTVPIKVEKIDTLMDIASELLVQRLRMATFVKQIQNKEMSDFFPAMEKNLEDLQYQIMKMRTLPLKTVYDYLPRSVRDFARSQQKEVALEVSGEELDLDRDVVSKLEEPLVHIIRNAIDHGIVKKGTIHIDSYQESDRAVVAIKDDGMGIDWDALRKKSPGGDANTQDPKELLFSGISTSDTVTEVSGRGIGLLAVKKMIETIGGHIDVESEKGKGTTFYLKIPMTLSVLKAMHVQSGGESFIIPILSIDRSVQVAKEHIKKNIDQDVFVLDEQDTPIVYLDAKLNIRGSNRREEKNEKTVVVVKANTQKFGLVVDEIIDISDVIVKSLPSVIQNSHYYIGTTILGDGKSALIIDPTHLLF